MIMMFRFLCALLLVSCVAQGQAVKPYAWQSDRGLTEMSATEAQLPEYIALHHMQFDYALENDQFLMYATLHRVVRLNNNEAVQRNNRIVIPMRGVLELVDLKARALTKDGKVVSFDKANLKELKDEGAGNAVRVFAMEGVEIGGEVEYYYTRKMPADLFNRAFMQFDVPVKRSSLIVSCPGHLEFDFKSYNSFPAPEKSNAEERNTYTASLDAVPGIKKEEFSNYDANRKRVDFKLAYNYAKSKARLFTWDDAAKRYQSVVSERTKDEDKALAKFVKSLDDDTATPQDARIKNVEFKIKTSIQIDKEHRGEAGSNLETIIKTRLASEEGITRLLYGVFATLNIPCHVVITGDRESVGFDGQFDSWSYLANYLLYFPDTKKFMSPDLFEMRYPLVPPNLTAMQGLFIEPVSVGGLNSALASVKDIPPASYDVNTDNMDVTVSFNSDMSANEVRFKRYFGGINAQYLAPYYDLMPENKRNEFVMELMKQIVPDPEIVKWTAKPAQSALVDGFDLDVTFTSAHFIEKAGPRVLLKVGEMIGPQVEMYRDDSRTTGVENDYNRGYDRVININIPVGYKIKNPDDLNMDVRYKDDKGEPYLFVSTYKIDGDKLAVNIKEYYKEIFAPLSRYEDFRKVINAAADFNKIVLVLEKK